MRVWRKPSQEMIPTTANRLVQFALDAGGRDNVTVVLVRCEFTETVENVTMDEDTLPPQLGDTIQDWEER